MLGKVSIRHQQPLKTFKVLFFDGLLWRIICGDVDADQQQIRVLAQKVFALNHQHVWTFRGVWQLMQACRHGGRLSAAKAHILEMG